MNVLRLESTPGWLAARDFLATFTTNSTWLLQAGSNETQQQLQFINELQYAAARSIRTSTIVLSAFNAVAAFATACGIIHSAYASRKKDSSNYWMGVDRSKMPLIQAADLFPLIISIGITIQGIVFSVAQAHGLQNLLSTGCSLVSHFMLPAIFIVPYIQLIFGVELAMRGLRKKPFPARGRYTTMVCLIVLGMLLLINFLVADLIKSPDVCFASLFWYVAIYSRGCFAVFLAIDIVLVLCTAVIFNRLTRTTYINVSERVSASRMIYYLAMGILSNTLIMPFFFSLGFQGQQEDGGNALTLSMVSSVVAGVSGLMTGGLYLFLRSTTISTIGSAVQAGEHDHYRTKDSIQRYDGGDPDFQGQTMGPAETNTNLRRMLSNASLISKGALDLKEEEAGMTYKGAITPAYNMSPRRCGSPHSSAFSFEKMASACVPEVSIHAPEPVYAASASIMKSSHMSAASIRDTPSSPVATNPVLLLPATTYKPASARANSTQHGVFNMRSLMPPPSLSNLIGRHHRRDSSMVSSATVQIGLRLSNFPFAPRESQMVDDKVYTIDIAGNDDSAAMDMDLDAAAAGSGDSEPEQERMTSAFLAQQQQPLQPLVLPPARRPSPLSSLRRLVTGNSLGQADDDLEDASPIRDPIKDARMKTLPPVPRQQGDDSTSAATTAINDILLQLGQPESQKGYNHDDDISGSGPTLSPSVYTPQQSPTKSLMTIKLPSPRGVGFAPVYRSKSSAVPRVSTTLRREASSASHTGAPNRITNNWI